MGKLSDNVARSGFTGFENYQAFDDICVFFIPVYPLILYTLQER